MINNKNLKIATVFSGIGSPEVAVNRVYSNAKTVFACEIDKFARQTYLANNQIDEANFHKDIYNLDGKQYRGKVDILVGGSPCQDFSIAGLRKGVKGERGKLIYEFIRILDEVKPNIFIYENVVGFTQGKMQKSFKEFQEALRNIGYYIHSDILNTKDYGVPQNRPRLYIVGFLDYDKYINFNYAPKQKLTKKLIDVLEDNVDEKYFLSEKLIKGFMNKKGTYAGKFNPHDKDTDYSNCLTARYSKCGITDPYIKVVGKLDIKSNEANKRVYDASGISPTLTTMQGGHQESKILEQRVYRKGIIRNLTPRECLRLQDFPDTFKIVCSDSQTYKQAGNAMSCNVLEMIFKQLKEPNKIKDTLF